MQGFVQDDEDPRCLAPRLRAVEAKLDNNEAKEADLYVCELRRIKSIKQPPPFHVPHPCALLGARKTKTLRKKQVADALGDLARWTLSWDTQDDGVFVGGRGAGKGLHVDQVLWSNVGHNYTGYKLLATWAPGSISTKLHDTMLDSVFTPPLKQDQLDALKQASRIVLLRPGDVFLMSGGVAHATLTVGSEELNLTAYESVVTLNPRHARHFLRSGDRKGDYATERGGMPRRELEDVALQIAREDRARAEERLVRVERRLDVDVNVVRRPQRRREVLQFLEERRRARARGHGQHASHRKVRRVELREGRVDVERVTRRAHGRRGAFWRGRVLHNLGAARGRGEAL